MNDYFFKKQKNNKPLNTSSMMKPWQIPLKEASCKGERRNKNNGPKSKPKEWNPKCVTKER
jgi:hypothetical protein